VAAPVSEEHEVGVPGARLALSQARERVGDVGRHGNRAYLARFGNSQMSVDVARSDADHLCGEVDVAPAQCD